jgi:hypothetical protein
MIEAMDILGTNRFVRWFATLSLAICGTLPAQVAVTTGHYDNRRTGAATNETILNPANVNRQHFGKLASVPVSGCIFAQPLFVPAVPTLDGGRRDLVFIATTANMVYAYDSNDYSLYFGRNFGPPVPSAEINPERGYHDFADCDAGDGDGPIGVVGTPVIDVADNAMYFVANTLVSADEFTRHTHILHKISLSTGGDLVDPVEIAGSHSGVTFNSWYHLQRAALLMLNGRIYIAFSSHQDATPYYGWMFAYDTELKQAGIVNYSPAKSGAGIWQSGGGPAADNDFIYFTTGNLAEDEGQLFDNSNSILKIDPVSMEILAKTSFFPEANAWDANYDLDLGSSRVILMQGTGQLVSGSKYGDVFLVNREALDVTTRFRGAARYSSGYDWTGIYNGLAYWNKVLYTWPGGGGYINGADPGFPTDTLKAFSTDKDTSPGALLADGQSDGVGAGYQGANIVISANGNETSTGIVWAYVPSGNSSWLQPGSLHAYSASDFTNGLFHELWNNVGLDPADTDAFLTKFNQPLIANGKVFLPTFSGKLIVYGLLPEKAPQP